jgi:hypothetical protein
MLFFLFNDCFALDLSKENKVDSSEVLLLISKRVLLTSCYGEEQDKVAFTVTLKSEPSIES